MRIFTRVIIDISTNRVISAESIEYKGPIAHLKSGSAPMPPPEPPPPAQPPPSPMPPPPDPVKSMYDFELEEKERLKADLVEKTKKGNKGTILTGLLTEAPAETSSPQLKNKLGE